MDATWAPVIGAGLGASAVLISQVITWASGSRRLTRELAQRELEATQRFLEPLRNKRLEALEQFHELIQDVLETNTLAEKDYLRVRPSFAYVDELLRQPLVEQLTVVAKSGELSSMQLATLRELQSEIRLRLALPAALRGEVND